MEGYSQVHNKKCVTIFSAPNYCYRYDMSTWFLNFLKDVEIKQE